MIPCALLDLNHFYGNLVLGRFMLNCLLLFPFSVKNRNKPKINYVKGIYYT